MSSPHLQASVVIPVFNDARWLRKTLAALSRQTYPSNAFEVIVVDNGSSDGSPDVACGFSGVELLRESKRSSSPYSARNRGIEHAQGEVIVLLDATCVPRESWLEEGLNCMEQQGADLIAGDVRFSYRADEPSTGEKYDSIANVQVKRSVAKGQAPTANLFVKRILFESIGQFPEGVRSGGDVLWTRQATQHGYKLAFCRKAVAVKPARSLSALLRKHWRVGKGRARVAEKHGNGFGVCRLLFQASFRPKFNWLREQMKTHGCTLSWHQEMRLLVVRYLVNFLTKSGQAYAVMLRRFR